MEASADPEGVLWQRSLAGDGEAFGRIFDMHRDRVFRHAYRLLRSIPEAEDATAVAFLELWRKRQRVRRVEDSVLPWLLMTAANASRNLGRSKRRYQQLLQQLPRTETAPSAEEQAAFQSDISPELAEAIAQLSAADAHLFSLIALEGYTPAEAAEALGSSSGAIRTRMHRIRARLQRQLGHTTIAGYLAMETT